MSDSESPEVADLKRALEHAPRAERQMGENLKSVQARCTELLEETRRLRVLTAQAGNR